MFVSLLFSKPRSDLLSDATLNLPTFVLAMQNLTFSLKLLGNFFLHFYALFQNIFISICFFASAWVCVSVDGGGLCVSSHPDLK